MEEIKTDILGEALNNSLSLKEGVEIIKSNITDKDDKTINEYFDEYFYNHPELSRAKVINDSEISRSYAHEILNGQKKGSRDRIIALCFAMGMSLDETNHALLYSQNSSLYPKNSRDALIILAINHKWSKDPDMQTIMQLNYFLYENNFEILKLGKDQ